MTPQELAAIVARDTAVERRAPNHDFTEWAGQSEKDRRALLALLRETRDEYQRFYDFVGESDPALVDAWHFTENAWKAGKP